MKLQLAAWALCVPFVAFSQITVDGNMNDALYYDIATYTSGNNGFGNDNDLGATKLFTTTTDIYLGITCEMDGNNRVVVVLDFTGYDGRGPEEDLGGGIAGFAGGGGCIDNAQLAVDADFMLAMNEGSGSTDLFVDGTRFGTGGVLNTGYLGNCNQTGTASTNTNYTGFGGNGSVTFAYQNDFASNSLKGVEMRINIDALPGISSTSELRSVFVFITNDIGGGSDETMPGNPSGGPYICDRYFLGSQYLSSNNTTLPIELISFESAIQQNGITLNWTTASELNNSHFEIERSTDGSNWQVIGQVNGAGTTTTERTYSYLDTRPAIGTNYYRLKQVDLDGAYDYSEVVSAVLRSAGMLAFSPNPASDILNVPAGIDLRIFDLTGKTLLYTPATGTSIDISALAAGYYLVEMNNGAERKVEKLVVE